MDPRMRATMEAAANPQHDGLRQKLLRAFGELEDLERGIALFFFLCPFSASFFSSHLQVWEECGVLLLGLGFSN